MSSSSIVEQRQHTTAETDHNNNVSVIMALSETNNKNNNVEKEVHHDQNLQQNPEQQQQRNHHHDDDDSRSVSSESSLKKAQTTIKEMIYCFESFSMMFTPVSICMILSALAVVFINTDETRQTNQEQFSKTYEILNISDTNSASKNTLSSIANSLIIVSVVCIMTFVVALLYKYRCMKIFKGYMILVTTILLGFLSSNMWIIIIEKYHWYRIDKFSFIFVIWNFTVVGMLSIFWPSLGIPKFVQQGYLIACSIILAWQLSFFSNWTAWTLLVILALYDLFAVLSPCGPLKYLSKLMSKSNAPEIPGGLLYEATLPNGISKPKSKRTIRNNDNDNDNDHNETKEQQQEEDDNNNNNNPPPPPSSSSSSAAAPSALSMKQQQQQSKSSTSSNKPAVEERRSSITLKTLPEGISSQFIVDNNNDQSSSSSSSRVLMMRRSSSVSSRNNGEENVVEVSQQQQQQQQQQDHEDDERQHQQQQQHPPPFFVSSSDSNGNKDEEKEDSPITTTSSSRIPLPQPLPLQSASAASAAAAAAAVTRNELLVVEEKTLPLNTGRIPLAIAKLYKLRVVDEEGALQPKQQKLLSWSRITARKNNNNNNNNNHNWQTHYTPNEVNEIEWTPKQLQTIITGIFPQFGGRVEKSTDEEDQNKEDEDGGPRYNVYNRNGDLLRKFVVNKEGQVMQVVKKERSEEDDDDSNNSIKLGLGDFIFYSVLVSKAALHSFTAFSACMVVILFGLLATLVLLAMYGKALPALPISIFLGVITFLITRSLTEPWIQDVLRAPFYV